MRRWQLNEGREHKQLFKLYDCKNEHHAVSKARGIPFSRYSSGLKYRIRPSLFDHGN